MERFSRYSADISSFTMSISDIFASLYDDFFKTEVSPFQLFSEPVCNLMLEFSDNKLRHEILRIAFHCIAQLSKKSRGVATFFKPILLLLDEENDNIPLATLLEGLISFVIRNNIIMLPEQDDDDYEMSMKMARHELSSLIPLMIIAACRSAKSTTLQAKLIDLCHYSKLTQPLLYAFHDARKAPFPTSAEFCTLFEAVFPLVTPERMAMNGWEFWDIFEAHLRSDPALTDYADRPWVVETMLMYFEMLTKVKKLSESSPPETIASLFHSHINADVAGSYALIKESLVKVHSLVNHAHAKHGGAELWISQFRHAIAQVEGEIATPTSKPLLRLKNMGKKQTIHPPAVTTSASTALHNCAV
jgi:hypothetical protein